MDAGIHSDQNFYRRQYQSSDGRRQYEAPEPPDFESIPPPPPPKIALVTNNVQAIAANGYAADPTSPPPDDFYREYRGIQSAQGYIDLTTNGVLMGQSTTAASRQLPSSFRSNGNGTTPKHPSISASRNALKPTYRSESATQEERMPLSTAKSTSALRGQQRPQQPSVKDLLKRFDQNNEHTSPSIRKPPIRTHLHENGTGAGYLRSRTGNQTQPTSGSSRAGAATRDITVGRAKTPTASRTTQRSRFATEDQHSNNTLSSVPRTSRTKNNISGNTQASQSMINLSPTFSSKPAPQSLSRKPLFGEVLPEEDSPSYLGFGIPEARGRRTSDSSLHQPTWRQRNQSDTDLPPPSPTTWYRGATPALPDDHNENKTSHQHRKHNRSQSDVVGVKSNFSNKMYSISQDMYSSSRDEVKQTTQSRLPISSKRLSIPSESASPPSTRSVSPSKTRVQGAATKTTKPERRPWSPAGRSTTPTSKPSSRQVRSPPKVSTNNSSLKVYISAPPPKTSPPLRSSRPRLPISTVTNTSAKGKSDDRSGSPKYLKSAKSARGEGENTKPVSHIGGSSTVDFAAHRERIQRAYSKSIQESEEKELRAARLRRLDAERKATRETHRAKEDMELPIEKPDSMETPIHIVVDMPQSPKLEVNTSFLTPSQAYTAPRNYSDTSNLDSPTLGIPGSFPNPRTSDEDEPPSAISNLTDFTEFDNEPQTEPGTKDNSLIHQQAPSTDSPRPHSEEVNILTPTDNGSIRIILDTMSVDENQETSFFPEFSTSQESHVPQIASDENICGEPVFVSTSTVNFSEDLNPSPESPIANQSISEDGAHLFSSDTANILGVDQMPPFGGQMFEVSDEEQSAPPSLPTLQTTVKMALDSEYPNTPVTEIDSEGTDDNKDAADSLVVNRQRPHRGSQQSAWTDYSVDSTDEYAWQGEHGSVPPLPSYQVPVERPQPPPKEELNKPEVPPKPANYSPLSSPRSNRDTPRLASPTSIFRPDYSFESGRRSSETARSSLHETQAVPPIPAWPNHSPPPPPQSSYAEMTSINSSHPPPLPTFYNRRPSSSVYRRDPESRRESDADPNSSRPSISTPLSSTRISLNDELPLNQYPDEHTKPLVHAEEDKEVTEKVAKRLKHRGRVIRELIDTESVYLKDMNVVEEIYKGTAEACPKLELNDVKIIFRNTDQIVAFSTMFLDELKAASASVYSPRLQKSKQSKSVATSPAEERLSSAATMTEETNSEKDRKTRVGEHFGRHIKEMQAVYTDFLKSSEQANSRLTALQSDPAVKVWLSECNLVAKDLTAAWDLDALLIKPVQRITRYQLLLNELLEVTPETHPDHPALQSTYRDIGGLLKSIDDLKRRIDTVNKIVNRKRKESDVRSGLAKAFGRSREKSLPSGSNRPADDEDYLRVHEKFGDDYLRLQVVLRDVEFYVRQTNTYVNEFLRYLSSIELVMRVSAGPHPELESKWARFNMSMRDMGTVALEDHVSAVRKQVIEPIEQVIKLYGPPDLAMKKRKKRRLDYERYLALKAGHKKVDDKLAELVEHYEALNETLKFELPKLSTLTEKIGKFCLIQFIAIQVNWFGIWQEKVKTVLEANQMPKNVDDIVDMFFRDYKYQQARIQELGIANGTFLADNFKRRLSQATTVVREDDASMKSRHHLPLLDNRPREKSVSGDHSPSLPTPDFIKTNSGQFSFSPIVSSGLGLPQFLTRDFPPSIGDSQLNIGSSAIAEDLLSNPYSSRPVTRMSFDSNGFPQESRSPSGSATFPASQRLDGPPTSPRPFSGLFHSAMPTEDADDSRRSSRPSSHGREHPEGYNVIYAAASLFEFRIHAIKMEAGYPYLTYGCGEIFDVIGEKGELWLARNQDDPSSRVGWIWSKHFGKFADFS